MIAQKARVVEFPIDRLTLDENVQMRTALNQAAILDYAEAYENGEKLPPIVVFESDNKRYVADGFHRVRAKMRLGHKKILCDMRAGTRRGALLYSVQANRSHGVRRTLDDKRRAIITLLKDKEWQKWTDTEIARATGTSTTTVAKYRLWMKPEKGTTKEEIRTYIDHSGRERTRTVQPRKPRESDCRPRAGDRCPTCGQRLPRYS